MHPRFQKQQANARIIEHTHLCDKVMQWYMPLVVGGTLTFVFGSVMGNDATRYASKIVGGIAVTTALSACAYGIHNRLRYNSTIPHVDDQQAAPVLPFPKTEL